MKKIILIFIICLISIRLNAQIVKPFQNGDFIYKAYDQYGIEISNSTSFTDNCFNMTNRDPKQKAIIYYKNKIDLSKSFVIEFNIKFGDAEGQSDGADGIAFILDKDSRTVAIGDNGGNLGVASIQSPISTKITPSFAIKFDTFRNLVNDPSISLSASEPDVDNLGFFVNGDFTIDNIIGVDVQYVPVGVSTVDLATNSTTTKKGLKLEEGNVEDGNPRCVKFEWDAAKKIMTVYFEGQLYYNLQYDIVNNIFNGNSEGVRLALTATTGSLVNNHIICIQNLQEGLVRTIPNQTICEGSKVKLRLSRSENIKNGIVTWTSIPNDPNLVADIDEPEVSPLLNTTYTVTITNKANESPTYSYSDEVIINVNSSSLEKSIKEIDTWKYLDALNNPIRLENAICGADKISDCGFLLSGFNNFKFLPNPAQSNTCRTMELVKLDNNGVIQLAKNYFRDEINSSNTSVDQLRAEDKYRSELHKVLDLGHSSSLENDGNKKDNYKCYSKEYLGDLGGTDFANGYLASGMSQNKNSPDLYTNLQAHFLLLDNDLNIKNSFIINPKSSILFDNNIIPSNVSNVTIIKKSYNNEIFGILNGEFYQSEAFKDDFIFFFKDEFAEIFDFKNLDKTTNLTIIQMSKAFFQMIADENQGLNKRVELLDIKEINTNEYIVLGKVYLSNKANNSRLFAHRFKFNINAEFNNNNINRLQKIWTKYYDFDLSNNIIDNGYNNYSIYKAFISKGNKYNNESSPQSIFLIFNTMFNNLPLDKNYNIIEIDYNNGNLVYNGLNKNFVFAGEKNELIALDENDKYLKLLIQNNSIYNLDYYFHILNKSDLTTQRINKTNFNFSNIILGDNIENFASEQGYTSIFAGNLFNNQAPMNTRDFIFVKNKNSDITCFEPNYINSFNIKMISKDLIIKPKVAQFEFIPHKMITADMYFDSKELCSNLVSDCCDEFNTKISLENITKRTSSSTISECCFKLSLNLKNRASSCGITSIIIKNANTIITSFNLSSPLIIGDKEFEFCYSFIENKDLTIELYNSNSLICSRILKANCICDCFPGSSYLIYETKLIKKENSNDCCFDLFVKKQGNYDCINLNDKLEIQIPIDLVLNFDVNWKIINEQINGNTKNLNLNRIKPFLNNESIYLGQFCFQGNQSSKSIIIKSVVENCTATPQYGTITLECANTTNCCNNIILNVAKINQSNSQNNNCCFKISVNTDPICNKYYKIFGKSDNELYYMSLNPRITSSTNPITEDIILCIDKKKILANNFNFRMEIYDESGNLLCSKDVIVPTDCFSCCDLLDFDLKVVCPGIVNLYINKLVSNLPSCNVKYRITKYGSNGMQIGDPETINVFTYPINVIIPHPVHNYPPDPVPMFECTKFKVELIVGDNIVCKTKEVTACLYFYGQDPCIEINPTSNP